MIANELPAQLSRTQFRCGRSAAQGRSEGESWSRTAAVTRSPLMQKAPLLTGLVAVEAGTGELVWWPAAVRVPYLSVGFCLWQPGWMRIYMETVNHCYPTENSGPVELIVKCLGFLSTGWPRSSRPQRNTSKLTSVFSGDAQHGGLKDRPWVKVDL